MDDTDTESFSDLFIVNEGGGSSLNSLKLDQVPGQTLGDGEVSYTILEQLANTNGHDVHHESHEQDHDHGMDQDGYDHGHGPNPNTDAGQEANVGLEGEGDGTGVMLSASQLQSLLEKVKLLEQQISTCLECHPILYEVMHKCGSLEERVKALEDGHSDCTTQVASEVQIQGNEDNDDDSPSSLSANGHESQEQEQEQFDQMDEERSVSKSEPDGSARLTVRKTEPMEQEEDQDQEQDQDNPEEVQKHSVGDRELDSKNIRRVEATDSEGEEATAASNNDTDTDNIYQEEESHSGSGPRRRRPKKPTAYKCKLCPKDTRFKKIFDTARALAIHYTAIHTYPSLTPASVPEVTLQPPPKRGRGRPRKDGQINTKSEQKPAVNANRNTPTNAQTNTMDLDLNGPRPRRTRTNSPQMERKAECSEWGQRFPNHGILERHMLTHTDTELIPGFGSEPEHRCELCNKVFLREGWLKLHIQMAKAHLDRHGEGGGGVNSSAKSGSKPKSSDNYDNDDERNTSDDENSDGDESKLVIAHETETQKQNGEQQPKGGHGRPPKFRKSVTKGVNEWQQSTPKRGRGRPPKPKSNAKPKIPSTPSTSLACPEPECKETFPNRWTLQYHSFSHKRSSGSSSATFQGKCAVCKKVFQGQDELKSHMDKEHVRVRGSGADTTITIQGPGVGRPKSIGQHEWPCGFCGRIFQYPSTLKLHKMTCLERHGHGHASGSRNSVA